MIIYSTYLGGSYDEEGFGIAVDSYGRAYVTGYTKSSDFPTSNPIQAAKGADGCAAAPCMDAFLSVLEANGQSFAYSTYLGGGQDDIANGIRLDANNNVYLVGETYSTNFPVTAGAYDVINTETNKRDAFITRIGALSAPSGTTFNHLDLPIAMGSDDAEQSASGSMSLTSTDIEIVMDASNQKVGLRFANVNLPQGAVISNAAIQFTVDEVNSEATMLTIQAQASDNAPTFTSTSNNISSRSRTTASVSWTPAAWSAVNESGPNQRTPNLASVIQETVSRTGWASGNAIAIIITGTGKRVAKSFEEDVYGVPYLHIEYTLPAPTSTPTPTATITPVNTPTFTPTFTSTPTFTPTVTHTPTPTITPTFTPINTIPPAITITPLPAGPVTIDYTYDPLHRLRAADYSTGGYYHYTYDSVGNRLTETTPFATKNYTYDYANRLSSANGVNYTFDANGNLLSDGVNTYTYDSANRLISVNNTTTYSYNGFGDRLTQNGTQYTLDLNAGLTQVLSNGTTSYTYGMGRISQQSGTTHEYFLSDALGSVRQLVNGAGNVTLAKSYDPYGVVTQSGGTSHTDYGFTGESYGDSTQLLYLRARYYNPANGRFQSRDTWDGDKNRPMSYNSWLYVYGNPINLTDPTGFSPYNPPHPSKIPCEESGGHDKRYCILNDGGYLDMAHFRGGKEHAKNIIQQLEKAKGKFNAPISYSRSLIVTELEYTHIVRIPANINKETMDSVALGIFLDFEYLYENMQMIDPRCAWNMVTCSSFSNEDLPSDYLGLVDFITKDKDFTDIISDLGGGWASKFKPSQYLSPPYDLMSCPDGICGDNTARNTDCTLKIFDPETNTFKNNPWPSSHPYMNIKPSGFGVYWGRSIFDFEQDYTPTL
jgi:RHS repeat-associated protein